MTASSCYHFSYYLAPHPEADTISKPQFPELYNLICITNWRLTRTVKSLLANLSHQTAEPLGISVDLATELARRLETKEELVIFDAAGKSVNAVESEEAVVGFFAVDPKRGEKISFTAP